MVTLRDRYTDWLPAGNRWHIDCFRCNTCGTILDSDANLLLLGDGSLICNNCTYSCSVCGNKIEDLAILTGDQAFCATCFKCRNCKKKIENLKYARTSQGIFCMECHESLMQRRRKKGQKNGTSRHKHFQPAPNGSAMLLDKSLPSLPPSAVPQGALYPEEESPPSETYSETPTELPPRMHNRPSNSRTRSDIGTPGEGPRGPPRRPPNLRSRSSKSDHRDRSPFSHDEERNENLTLPSKTYHNQRNSAQSHKSEESTGEGFFIPMALDPNPAPGPSPLARRENHSDTLNNRGSENRPNATDYFNAINANSRKLPNEQDKENRVMGFPTDSPADSRHSSQPNSPHIAYQYQDRGRKPSSDLSDQVRKKKEVVNHSNSVKSQQDKHTPPSGDARSRRNGENQNGKFTLQDAPKKKRNSKSDPAAPPVDTTAPTSKTQSAPGSTSTHFTEQQVILPSQESPNSSRSEATLSGSPRDTHGSTSLASTDPPSSHSSPLGNQLKTLPQRGDSLAKGKQPLQKKELDVGTVNKLSSSKSNPECDDAPASAPPTTTTQAGGLSGIGLTKSLTRAQDSPSSNNFSDAPPPPLRARERLALQNNSSSDSFVAPRVPPNPPNTANKVKNDPAIPTRSDSVRNEGQPGSPKLQRYPTSAEYSQDEDAARSLGEDGQPEQGGFLRRVSHSVRHARSYSDRGTRSSKEQKWPKSPLMLSGSHSPAGPGLSSPTASPPDNKEEISWFKTELRRERQRNLEQEQRLAELEAALEAKTTIKQMNTELREKRSTMVVLDTQKEIVVRELEVLTEHIASAKKSGEPLDVAKLSNAALREFADSLQKLKESFAPQIEDLTQRRNELQEELSNLTQLKDKSFQEFEQLSLKNAQLADLNNQLVHQIQELYKANAGPPLDIVRPPPHGLGIYTNHNKEKSNVSVDTKDPRPSLTDSNLTGSTVIQEQEVESAPYLAAPQVVNIRKAQPKKFNWKKGGHNMAKGVTKGLKAAFNDGNRSQRDGQFTEGIPYGQMQQQEYPTNSLSRSQTQEPRPGIGGFFANPKQRSQQWKNSPNGSVPAVNSDGVPALFGSELEQRAEYERTSIPGIVMRCIQEVDARGMDIEGIYRKSGGNSQIQVIKEGFERSNDFDISDPDLDINAVTSTLKQYFRKLPTPLITYEVYDKLLETLPAPNQDIDPSHPAHPANPNNYNYRVSSMRHAIDQLPARHRDVLELLMLHLARVVEQQSENLMTSANVAVVFAPTVMRPESLAREMQDTQAKNSAVQFLIENCQAVFWKSQKDEGSDVQRNS
ncbi:Rho-type gtpase-activating protein [Lecanora helva]